MSDKVQKIITDVQALSVLELADLVSSLEDKFGVSAAPAVASGVGPASTTAPATGEPVEEQSSFNVILSDAGANKIAVIKALREINLNLGLKDAKDLSEKPNAEILTGVNKATADEAKAKLTAAGAKVELK